MGQPAEDDDVAIQREERAIYGFIVAASAPVVIGFAIEGGALDGGATLSLVLVVLGVAGLIAGLVAAVRGLAKPRIPRASLHNDA